MPTDARGDQPRLRLYEERLLLVEGKDEVNLFEKLIDHCVNVGNPGIQVIPVGGESQFKRNLAAIITAAQTGPTLQSIGIVRDADKNAQNSFKSVCDSVRHVNYKPPSAHSEFSNVTPSIGVFIVPDGTQPGAIETVCRQSVESEETAKCVVEYLDCLTKHNAMKSTNEDKSFAHAYLAAWKDPVARVGEAALQGVWDFQLPAFFALSQFIRNLAAQGN